MDLTGKAETRSNGRKGNTTWYVVLQCCRFVWRTTEHGAVYESRCAVVVFAAGETVTCGLHHMFAVRLCTHIIVQVN
jgi:hypothetical protein